MDATENLNLTDLKTEPEMGVFAPSANNDTETTATEIRASATPDVLPVNECGHMVYVNEGALVLMHARLRLTYCPKCGEKL
jgi:hypothetical protein